MYGNPSNLRAKRYHGSTAKVNFVNNHRPLPFIGEDYMASEKANLEKESD